MHRCSRSSELPKEAMSALSAKLFLALTCVVALAGAAVTLKQVGEACYVNPACVTGRCSASTKLCEPAAFGKGSCLTHAQCTTGSCDTSKSVCDYSNVQEPCLYHTDCYSLRCDKGTSTCLPSFVTGKGQCASDAECSTMKCNLATNKCSLAVALEPCGSNSDCTTGRCENDPVSSAFRTCLKAPYRGP